MSDDATDRRTESIDYGAIADLRSSLRRFEHATEAVTSRCGLTRRRYELLAMIAGAKDGSRSATISQLAARMYLETHTTTELVGRAERAGLVTRSRDAHDGRVTRVRLTATGERRLQEAAAALLPERERLTRLLGEIHQRARALSGAGP